MTHFDFDTRNWIDFDEEHEDMLADYGADVAAGVLSAEDAITLVAAAQRLARAES